jgi:ergothioneine biosynthesis protein EgtB
MLKGDLARYQAVRARTEALCAPLSPEDMMVQSMPDASPAKWHLAHTTWFFETFLLAPHLPGYRPFDPRFAYLFNSYYNAVGERILRSKRGTISRPGAEQVFDYRRAVDRAMAELLQGASPDTTRTLAPLVELGLNHEQQHQELILTDIKHAFGTSPVQPAYQEAPEGPTPSASRPLGWVRYGGGVVEVGHDGRGFAFDNESPRHRVYLEPYELANRLVTNGEYLAFIEDRGYERPELWLSEGFEAVRSQGWGAPEYWHFRDGTWRAYTLSGLTEINQAEPVCHVSYYEADAYARWAGARLPAEAEWEAAAAGFPIVGNLQEAGRFHPAPAPEADSRLSQLFGDVWEWTGSAYLAYPNFRPAAGAIGEYNGKFMCGQMVLRGGSCATPATHIRASYRNFFPPGARWQFSGIRLARGARP